MCQTPHDTRRVTSLEVSVLTILGWLTKVLGINARVRTFGLHFGRLVFVRGIELLLELDWGFEGGSPKSGGICFLL